MLPHWLEALLNHSSVLAFLRDHNLCKDPQGQRHRFRWAATCVQSDGPQSGLGADSGGFQNGSTAQDGLPSVFNQVDGHQSGFGRAPERGRSFRWAATSVALRSLGMPGTSNLCSPPRMALHTTPLRLSSGRASASLLPTPM